jgi:pyrroline-5-carboxylate reductase
LVATIGCGTLGKIMYTFEISIGWLEEETVTVTTHDFTKIQALQQFFEFMEENGWDAEYEIVESLDLEDEEDEEDTEEELEGSDSKD